MLYSILGLVILVLDIMAIIEIISSSMAGTNKILWVLVILLLPVLGLILYYLLGRSGGRTNMA